MILGFDRRYVFLPVVVSVVLVVSAFVVVEGGQARLRASAARIQDSQQRLALLGQFARIVGDAETNERGFLLTNDKAYLDPYEEALAAIDPALDALGAEYRKIESADSLDRIRELRSLTSQKIGAMELTIAYQKVRGPDSGRTLVRTDVDRRLSADIRDLIGRQRDLETAILADISRESERETSVTRMITLAGATLNIALIIVAGILITREIKRRMAAAAQLEAEKVLLEREVAARTAELSALSSHLQDVSESEKAELARELHDELGGLLISAKMDISALRRKYRTDDPDGNRRWDRIMAALDAGVDLKRRVVEQLHPTLLDNMGLYSAIRWQFQESCGRAGLTCTESLPEHELPLSKEAAIAIFRIAQESMTNILKHARATAAHVEIKVLDEVMIVIVRDNGVGFPPERLKPAGASGWASMRHRIDGLGGSWRAGPGLGGAGTEIQVRLPLDRIQIAPA